MTNGKLIASIQIHTPPCVTIDVEQMKPSSDFHTMLLKMNQDMREREREREREKLRTKTCLELPSSFTVCVRIIVHAGRDGKVRV